MGESKFYFTLLVKKLCQLCKEKVKVKVKVKPRYLPRYTYLFKGLEDLRLDERVMQLLGVCNVMFSSRGCSQYSVTQYSVTPLGPRSGT